jgi:ethanolamine utilization cobalamin adenosyltransferase
VGKLSGAQIRLAATESRLKPSTDPASTDDKMEIATDEKESRVKKTEEKQTQKSGRRATHGRRNETGKQENPSARRPDRNRAESTARRANSSM